MERLLTVDQAAEVLGTAVRFSRRLIAKRRIRFARVGSHVRIPASALAEFIDRGTVEPGPGPDSARAVGGLMPRKRSFGTIRQLPSGRWHARYAGSRSATA